MEEKDVLFCVIILKDGAAMSPVKLPSLLTETISNSVCLVRPKPGFIWLPVSGNKNIFQTLYKAIVSYCMPALWKITRIGQEKATIMYLNIFDIE